MDRQYKTRIFVLLNQCYYCANMGTFSRFCSAWSIYLQKNSVGQNNVYDSKFTQRKSNGDTNNNGGDDGNYSEMSQEYFSLASESWAWLNSNFSCYNNVLGFFWRSTLFIVYFLTYERFKEKYKIISKMYIYLLFTVSGLCKK